MRVAIVTVGEELLTGDTVNTNATWLCERLTDRGVTVERITTLPDRIADIARVVNEYRAEYDAVIVTGGVGPTHDDVTMDGVAAAFGRDLIHSEEAHQWLIAEGGYAAEDLLEGTAHIPDGATPLHNSEGVAPGAAIDSVYVLPGVPTEMKAMFEQIADEFEGQRRYSEMLRVENPESELIPLFETLRNRFDVSVGSYPGENVRVKLSSTDREAVRSAARWLQEYVTLVEDPGDE